MADPFSIVAGVFGIIVPALDTTRHLLDDLKKISEAPAIVNDLSQDIGFVETTLESLKTVSEQEWIALGTTLIEQSRTAIESCTKSCAEFRTELQRWTRHSNEGDISWRDRASIGIFQRDQIKVMSRQLQKYRTTLNLVVSTATL